MKASESAREAIILLWGAMTEDEKARIRAGDYDDAAGVQAITQAEARGREQGLREAATVADSHNLAGFRLGEAQTLIVNSITALIPGEPA